MNDYGTVGGLGTLVWVFTALLLLLVVVTTLASRGTIPSNPFLGIRLPSLRRSESAWRAGHTAAIPAAWVGFVGALICAVVGLYFPVAHWGVFAFFVGSVVWAMLAASRAALAAT